MNLLMPLTQGCQNPRKTWSLTIQTIKNLKFEKLKKNLEYKQKSLKNRNFELK